MIRQGGIETISNLLDDTNPHIVVSALNIIIATAAAGCEEELISGGIIAKLDPMQKNIKIVSSGTRAGRHSGSLSLR